MVFAALAVVFSAEAVPLSAEAVPFSAAALLRVEFDAEACVVRAAAVEEVVEVAAVLPPASPVVCQLRAALMIAV